MENISRNEHFKPGGSFEKKIFILPRRILLFKKKPCIAIDFYFR